MGGNLKTECNIDSGVYFGGERQSSLAFWCYVFIVPSIVRITFYLRSVIDVYFYGLCGSR